MWIIYLNKACKYVICLGRMLHFSTRNIWYHLSIPLEVCFRRFGYLCVIVPCLCTWSHINRTSNMCEGIHSVDQQMQLILSLHVWYMETNEDLLYSVVIFLSFILDTTVKQGDVILLGYPLQMMMPKRVRRNDLNSYAHVGYTRIHIPPKC